jgi:hypothetical protein
MILQAKMFISSNQLAGRGSVSIPIVTTMGAKPYNKAVRVFWKTKSASNNFSASRGSDAKLRIPLDWRLLGTGIFKYGKGMVCYGTTAGG